MRSASFSGLLVALDDRHRVLVLGVGNGARQQGRLARARAGDEIDGKDAALSHKLPVAVLRVAVVDAQDVLLDLHHAGLAEIGIMNDAHSARMLVGMTVVVGMIMIVVVIMVMVVIMGVPRLSAAARQTH